MTAPIVPTPAIPRRISFFFTGERLSFCRYMTFLSFRRLNPDWQIDLYTSGSAAINRKPWGTPEQQDFFSYRGPDYFDRLDALSVNVIPWQPPEQFIRRKSKSSSLNPVHQSDICRWEVLRDAGGFYADTDILFVRPLDERIYPAIVATGADVALYLLRDNLPIGFLAARPGTSFYADVYSAAVEHCDQQEYQSAGADAIRRVLGFPLTAEEAVGPSETRMRLAARYPSLLFTNLFPQSIYPWAWNQVGKIFKELLSVSSLTAGIHWFAGARLSQSWNGSLTHENFRGKRYVNTWTKYAARIWEMPAEGMAAENLVVSPAEGEILQ